jgi:hypothetical protein
LAGPVDLFAQGTQLPLSLSEDLDLLLKHFGGRSWEFSLFLVVLLYLIQVLLDLGLDLIGLVLELAGGEVSVAGIDGLEF